MSLDIGTLVDGLPGLLFVALGVWVAAVRPARRVNRLFGLHAVAHGTLIVAMNLGFLGFGLAFSHAALLVAGAAAVVAGVALVAFGARFPTVPSATERRALRWTLVFGIAFGSAYLHAITNAGNLVRAYGLDASLAPSYAVVLFGYWIMTSAIFAVAASWTLRFAWSPPGRLRRQCALLTIATLLLLAPQTGAFLVRGGTWTPGTSLAAAWWATGTLALAALWLWTAARSREDAWLARNVALLILGLMLAGMVAAVALGGWAGFANSGFAGVNRILFLGVLAYAIVRHQLFDVDLRLKRGIRRIALPTLLVLVYLAVVVPSQVLLEPALGRGLGVAAVVLLLVAAFAVRGLGARVAERLLPHVQETPEYVRRRKREVFAAAVEQALDDAGEVPGTERVFLDGLASELRLPSDEAARVIEHVRARDPRSGLAPGRLFLGRYRVLRTLGSGAAGEVFHCRDEELGEDVALKRLAGELRRSAEARERFRDEARLVDRAQDPRIVRVLRVEVLGDDAVLVLEYLPGGSLEDRIRERGALPEPEAVRIAHDVLGALGALHAHGIVHGDVKPANILLDGRGGAKLADFTVAREHVSGETVGAPGTDHAVGTPAYMAPEVARGLRGSARSDLYSAALVLVAALTGKPPVDVEGLSPYEARRRAADAVPPLPVGEASAGVNEALVRALAEDAARRYPSAEEMARALGGPPSGAASRRRR